MQLFERMLRCDRVYEKNKQRLRLREAGYASLSLLFSELHITPTLIRCLLNQVLHTGQQLFIFADHLFNYLLIITALLHLLRLKTFLSSNGTEFYSFIYSFIQFFIPHIHSLLASGLK